MSHATFKYPKMEYLFTGDSVAARQALRGSWIRAKGKGWNVQFIQPGSIFDSPPPDLVLVDEQVDESQLNHLRQSEALRGTSHFIVSGHSETELKYDLISTFSRESGLPGKLTAFVGNGKGKTTGSLGMAWELANSKKVVVIQWFKEKAQGRLTWAINEHHFPETLEDPNLWTFEASGAGFFGSPALDRVTGEEAAQIHRQKAREGLQLAQKALQNTEVGVVVLDELLDTLVEVMPSLPSALLFPEEVVELLSLAQESQAQVVVTGRRVPDSLKPFFSDIITVSATRHPWTEQKRAAVSGLDF